MDLSGRRAVVTGGARRLGRAFALALAEAGADVVITSRSADDALDGARHVVCDVRSASSVSAAVTEAAALLGGIDVLVNNAGFFSDAALEELTVAQWDEAYEVNTRGPFLVAQAALPFLRASAFRGRIVNIGSLGGLRPWVAHGHYCASKAALHMLTETMAKAWAPAVSVNCVAPGMIQLPGEPERLAAKTPMGRDGAVEDVVAAVMFFAAAPGFITGQVLAVDGGLGLA